MRAAHAIATEVHARSPDCKVEIVDFWSLIDAETARAIQQTYLRLVNEKPELYHRLWGLDQHSWRNLFEDGEPLPALLHELGELIVPPEPVRATDGRSRRLIDRLLLRQLAAILARPKGWSLPSSDRWQQIVVRRCWALLARRLRGVLRGIEPDVVVATQVNMAALAAALKEQRALRAPLVGVLTDYGVHDFWLQAQIDAYCIADESMASALCGSGRAPAVEVTGIPLMPGFAAPPTTAEARGRLGIPQDARVLLVLGGGLGIGIDTTVRRLIAHLGDVTREGVPIVLQVLTGRNEALQRQLAHVRCPAGIQLRVHGWSEQIEVMARAADLVIGKPGGLTVAEMLACGRPLLSTCSLRGQESFNVDYLQGNGVGGLYDEALLPAEVARLLTQPAELTAMQSRAWHLGRRGGAGRIVDLMQRLCDLPDRSAGSLPGWRGLLAARLSRETPAAN